MIRNANVVFSLFLLTNTLSAGDIELNAENLKFAKANLGKQVDRGECWDVAAIPLKERYSALS